MKIMRRGVGGGGVVEDGGVPSTRNYVEEEEEEDYGVEGGLGKMRISAKMKTMVIILLVCVLAYVSARAAQQVALAGEVCTAFKFIDTKGMDLNKKTLLTG